MPNIVEILIRAKDEASAAIGKIDKSTKDLAASGAVLAGIGLGVAASLGAMAKQAADAGDEANDAAKRLGIATQAVAGLRLAADQSGTSFESLSTGMGKLAKDAAAGGEKLAQLGISARDSNGHLKPMDGLLGEVADKFAVMKDGTAKTALAIDLFGKSGAELVPILDGGSAALKEAADKAQLYHTAIGPEAAAAGDRFNDAQREMQEALSGLSITIGSALVPALTDIVEAITPVIAGISDFVATHPQAIEFVGALSAALVAAGGVLIGLAATSIPAVSTALTALGASTVVATGGISLLVAAAFTFRKEIASVFANAIANIIALFEQMVSAAGDVAGALGASGLSKTLEDARAKIHSAWQATDKFRVSVLDTTDHVGDMERALGKKTKAHKLDSEAVIVNTAATESATKAQEKLNREIRDAGEFWQKAERDTTTAIRNNLDLALSLGELRMKRDADRVAMERWWEIQNLSVQTTNLQIQGFKNLTAELQPLIDSFNTDLAIQNEVNKTVAESNKAMGISADLVAELTGVRREDVIAIREHSEENKTAASEFQRIWETTTANMTAAIGGSFKDLLHGDFKGAMDGMLALLKTTGDSMYQSVVTGFITPFTSALSKLGSNLASLALSAIGIGSGPAGGLLGGITGSGGILGGILGGGGAAGGGAAAGGAGAGGAGGLGAVGGLLTNPWTIAIGAGILGVTAWLKSQAHHEANKLVKEIENPFWQAWGQILPSDQAGVLQSLPAMEAQGVGSNLKQMNSNYLSLIEQFRKGGSDEERVSQQSLANTQPHVTMALEALRLAVTAGGQIPSFRVGIASLPSDMIASVHKGEQIVKASDNVSWGDRLTRIEELLSKPLTVILNMDGKELSRGIVDHLYNGTRDEGWVLIGSR